MTRVIMGLIKGMMICYLLLFFLFVIYKALSSPEQPYFSSRTMATIDCSDTADNDGCYEHPECCDDGEFEHLIAKQYVCDPHVNGDCSLEGIQMLSDQGIFITVLNDDPEYGCDDTSCECEWQDCYVAPANVEYE